MKKYIPYVAGTILAVFGMISLFLTSSVIFDLFGIREQEGNYVLFIVWANFIAGMFYLFAATGFFRKEKWTTTVLLIPTVMLTLAIIGLFFHISSGGIYETKTVGAMIFRILFTLTLAGVSYFTFKNKTT